MNPARTGEPQFGTVEWALDQPIRHSGAKFLLVVLAAECGAGASCAPTTKRLGERIVKHRRSVDRLLTWLECEGWIERGGVAHGRRVYTLSAGEKTAVGRRFASLTAPANSGILIV